MSYPNEAFQVKTAIWNKDVKGLFNYQLPKLDIKTNTFTVSNNCKVYRDDDHDENYFRPAEFKLNEHFKFVCQLDAENDEINSSCWLRVQEKHQRQPAKNIPYLVVKRNKNQARRLALGDIIKIGTVQFTVMQLSTQNGKQTLFDKDIPKLKHLGWVYQVQKLVGQERPKNQKKQTILNEQEKKQEKVELQEKSETIKPIKKYKKIKKQQKSKYLKSRAATKQNKQLIEAGDLQNDENQIQNGRNESQIQNQYESSDIENEIQIGEDYSEQTFKPALKQEVSIKQTVQIVQPKRCKICLMEEQQEQNPFVSPCLCKGSCAAIHIDCLREWVSKKISASTKQEVKSIQLKSPRCEICKYLYPKIIKNGKKSKTLMQFQTPNQPYIILQKFYTLQPQILKRYLVVIKGNTQKIVTIGRDESADIFARDLSVSRTHAEIFYSENQFYIRDRRSKFGTLLQIQRDIQFGKEGVSVQLGRCLYEFKHLMPQKNSAKKYLDREQM